MKKKFNLKNILLVSFLAMAGIFGISSAIIGGQKVTEQPVMEKADASDHTYYVAGLDQGSSWSPDKYQMLDSDDDGIFTYNYVMPKGNTVFCICQDGGWTTTYRFNNLLIQAGGSSWSDGDDGNVGIWHSNDETYAITICFRESDQAIMVFPQGSVPASWNTFYLVVTNGWNDWANPRLHFWGSNWNVVWNNTIVHCPPMTNLSRTYTGGGYTGALYSISIPTSTTGVKALKQSITDGATDDLSVSASIDGASLYYSSTNKLSGFKYIENGYYLRGIYQGNEDWSNNAVLSNTTVTESIAYNSTDSQLHATLELYGGDTFKFVRYEDGDEIQNWVAAQSVESSDATYYPVSQDGNANFVVSNDGIYYLNLGYGNTYGDTQYWWCYFDNSASVFAYEFLNSMTCDGTGVSGPTWKQIPDKEDYYSWEYFSDYYTYHLDDYAKDTFYDAESNPSGTNIENAVARYQIIVKNHGYTPFMRNSSNVLRSAPTFFNPLKLVVDDGNNVTTLIIIIASSVALLSVTALSILVIKKRKQKEE